MRIEEFLGEITKVLITYYEFIGLYVYNCLQTEGREWERERESMHCVQGKRLRRRQLTGITLPS